ncbi:hypothetical protein BGZ61DRAFT_458797 [Ilyonectria robusta]|uniref:uncharacterized protein n=1 Tax=Ilyonectria robusta TaxID=1079257 RepID=UPI001E8E8709|nr:uncharacterized protein BGZ61DRAFT_458797 [Ilyonectria robusta]KAH8673093.1 hypothetical protein BGZ61DRAFT_458797 [Ilyonectria robusta]
MNTGWLFSDERHMLRSRASPPKPCTWGTSSAPPPGLAVPSRPQPCQLPLREHARRRLTT